MAPKRLAPVHPGEVLLQEFLEPPVEHWMNGQKLLEYELGSPDREAKAMASRLGGAQLRPSRARVYRNPGRSRRRAVAQEYPDPGIEVTLLERLRRFLAERYQVERELGQGGMATVFLAQDLKHGRQVAIKVLTPAVGAAIGHPGEIAALFAFLASEEAPYITGHPVIIDGGEIAGGLASR